MAKMKLCGGTFLTLLMEIKRDNVSNSECLKYLVKAFVGGIGDYKDSTYTSKTSQYKTCVIDHARWLPFDKKNKRAVFIETLEDAYNDRLKIIDTMIEKCLSKQENEKVWLVRAVLELIEDDDSILEENKFYVDGSYISRNQLLRETAFEFDKFLLSVWQYIIIYVPNNTEGQSTLNIWQQNREKHTIGEVPAYVGRKRFLSVKLVKHDVPPDTKDYSVGDTQPAEKKQRIGSKLEERMMASAEAVAEVWSAAIANLENSFGKTLLYASNVLSSDEVEKLRENMRLSVDADEYGLDRENTKVIYRWQGEMRFYRKLDEFMNQNIVMNATIDDIEVESITSFENWKSKSFINNVVSSGKYFGSMWFKIVGRTTDKCLVQVMLIEEY